MKKLCNILPWAALLVIALTLSITLAALRQAWHNKTLEKVDVRLIAQKKLRSRVKCTLNINKNNIAELIARKKAELKK